MPDPSRTFSLLSILWLSATLSAQDAPKPPAAMAKVQKEELLRHANWLADDARGGRLTGSKGQEEAARYIQEHFAELGLEPLGDEVEADDGERARGYVQHYGIERTEVAASTAVMLGTMRLDRGFSVLKAEELRAKATGKLVYCGFGRTRDLPDDVDLKGRIAVVSIKQPRGRLGRELTAEAKFMMNFMGPVARFARTARRLTGKGAAGVVFIMHEDPFLLADVLNVVAAAPGKPVIKPNFPGGQMSMPALNVPGDEPALVLGVEPSKQLLAELAIPLDEYEDFLKGDGDLPAGRRDVDGALDIVVDHDPDARASNVVAVLRGSDPQLRDQAIVYSAHMDHVGIRMDGDVFNGADDNASGSAGLLAIATAFATAESKPRRSIIFLSVSGEELGLWGSQYYSDNPTWRLDRLVANINTDMIGRSGPESGELEVTVTPSHRHAKYSTIVRDSARFASTLGMTFTDGDKYYLRSDHFNFARKGIPVVFYCNGEHEDYHQVSDHADKLDGDKMERIARLAFWTGWHVANADDKPKNLGRQKEW